MTFFEEGTTPMQTSNFRRSILPLGLAGAVALAMAERASRRSSPTSAAMSA